MFTAEAIWEKPLAKNFFNFTPIGGLKINLIYDYRQESTDELKKLGITIDGSYGAYDKLKAEYNSLIKKYDASKADLEKMASAYNSARKEYEQIVHAWNKKGGATAGEFKKLEAERLDLDAQGAKINQAQDDLNKIVSAINATVNVMNRLVKELNLKVENYNTIGSSVGKEFQEGEYARDANGERINIYQFDSKNNLVRVLAHELGHALGLEHNDNPDSIMYRLNEGKNEKLSTEDIQAVKSLCRIKP